MKENSMSENNENMLAVEMDEKTEICFSILYGAVKKLEQKIDARFDALEKSLGNFKKLTADLKNEEIIDSQTR